MKKLSTLVTVMVVLTMLASFMVGCSKDTNEPTDNQNNGVTDTENTKNKTSGDTDTQEEKMFTMFNAVPGTEMPDDNININLQTIISELKELDKLLDNYISRSGL